MSKIRGSEWRKWDLHFHTPSSYDYGAKDVSNQEIIDGLANNGISVVAVTDHQIMDLERIRDLHKLGKEKNITVLPGIEFLSDSRGREPIHFIGIFDFDEQRLDFIWKQIESKTALNRIEGEGKNPKEVYCELFETVDLIKNLGGLVTIHAGAKSNGIENITHSLPHGVAQKTDIAEKIDIFEIGKETDLNEYKEKVIPFLHKKINKHLPIIICSDNHNIRKYDVKQNLWLKADPTFEGLKQILYEPEHRIKIQKEKPDYKEEKLIIDSIKFSGTSSLFNPTPIYLNPNLNVVIGGKSSGKSILLYHIAKTLMSGNDFFEKESLTEKYKFRETEEYFNFKVTTKGGFSQELYKAEEETKILPEIKYIPQNYLVKLAEPSANKKGAALNKIVRDLINEDPDSATIYDDFVSDLRANDRKLEQIIDDFFHFEEKQISLEGKLQSHPNKEILEKNIISNEQKVEELNKASGLSEKEIENYNSLQKELSEVNQELDRFRSDYRKMTDFTNEMQSFLDHVLKKKDLTEKSLQHEEVIQFFRSNVEYLEQLKTNLSSLNEILKIEKGADGKSYFKTDSPVKDILIKIDKKRKELRSGLEPYIKNEELKTNIKKIQDSIAKDKLVLQAIQQIQREITENKLALKEEKTNLFSAYEQNYQKYLELINNLSARTSDLENDGLGIIGEARLNFSKLQKVIMSFSDGRSASFKNYLICQERKDSEKLEFEILIKDLKEMFESIVERKDYILNKKSNRKAAIKELMKDYFYDYWEIEYKQDKLGQMSTGKASFVILMLIIGLSRSKAPILIDQPEDNLDNRSITTELVEYLRGKKLERQIVLVTHNPNVVVNADAENIIVANQEGQNGSATEHPYKFDYINGSLENTFFNESEDNVLKRMGIREHIADIVEGGKEAFQKRERKYGF